MKPIKLKNSTFENLDLPNYDMINNVIGEISNDLNNKLENSIIEGLKRKGFEFKHKFELEKFIKEHCRCEDNVELKERIYFVHNIPFFLHNYESEINLNLLTKDDCKTISAIYGSFTYL